MFLEIHCDYMLYLQRRLLHFSLNNFPERGNSIFADLSLPIASLNYSCLQEPRAVKAKAVKHSSHGCLNKVFTNPKLTSIWLWSESKLHSPPQSRLPQSAYHQANALAKVQSNKFRSRLTSKCIKCKMVKLFTSVHLQNPEWGVFESKIPRHIAIFMVWQEFTAGYIWA